MLFIKAYHRLPQAINNLLQLTIAIRY